MMPTLPTTNLKTENGNIEPDNNCSPDAIRSDVGVENCARERQETETPQNKIYIYKLKQVFISCDGDAHGAIELIYKFYNYRLFDGTLHDAWKCVIFMVNVSCDRARRRFAHSTYPLHTGTKCAETEKKQIF